MIKVLIRSTVLSLALAGSCVAAAIAAPISTRVDFAFDSGDTGYIVFDSRERAEQFVEDEVDYNSFSLYEMESFYFEVGGGVFNSEINRGSGSSGSGGYLDALFFGSTNGLLTLNIFLDERSWSIPTTTSGGSYIPTIAPTESTEVPAPGVPALLTTGVLLLGATLARRRRASLA